LSPVFRHGSLRLYLLRLLDEEPRHGYEVIRLLRDRFMGVYSPSPGTIYPRLARLEEEGLVTHDEIDGRKVYRITEAGREELRSRSDELDELEEELSASVSDIVREVREDVRQTVRSLREELTWAARESRRASKEVDAEFRDQAKQARQQAMDEARRAREEALEEARRSREHGLDQATRAREDAKEQATRAREDAKEQATRAREEAKNQATRAREEAKDQARRAKEAAKGQYLEAHEQARQTRDDAWEQATDEGLEDQPGPAGPEGAAGSAGRGRAESLGQDAARRVREHARRLREEAGARFTSGEQEWETPPGWSSWTDWPGRRGWEDWARMRGRRGWTGSVDFGTFRDLERVAVQFTSDLRRLALQSSEVGENVITDLRTILEDALERIKTEIFGAGSEEPAQHDADQPTEKTEDSPGQ
jgi:DNA-binding PadR family transcriptional regulator